MARLQSLSMHSDSCLIAIESANSIKANFEFSKIFR